VATLHGEMSKLQRQAVLREFRAGRYRALIVSDVLARGMDVQDCDAVIHLELPSSAAHYAHRCAPRGGGGGAAGLPAALCASRATGGDAAGPRRSHAAAGGRQGGGRAGVPRAAC
jgi:superfamily II DNA/RNA helicase